MLCDYNTLGLCDDVLMTSSQCQCSWSMSWRHRHSVKKEQTLNSWQPFRRDWTTPSSSNYSFFSSSFSFSNYVVRNITLVESMKSWDRHDFSATIDTVPLSHRNQTAWHDPKAKTDWLWGTRQENLRVELPAQSPGRARCTTPPSPRAQLNPYMNPRLLYSLHNYIILWMWLCTGTVQLLPVLFITLSQAR